MHCLDRYIGINFKKHKIVKIASIICHIKYGQLIPKGTLVIMASGDSNLRLKILDQDTPNKGFSTPLVLKEAAQEKGITPNYLLWYLSQTEVAKILMQHATGAVFLRIPKSIIESVPVPIPKKIHSWRVSGDSILKKAENSFKQEIDIFYNDYVLNVKHKRYQTAIILAAAICEAMLLQILLESGVDQKLLEEDRQLALGRLIKYTKLLKLDRSLGIPLNHIIEIQKKRNQAVHIGAKSLKMIFSHQDLKDFDQVIKYFSL